MTGLAGLEPLIEVDPLGVDAISFRALLVMTGVRWMWVSISLCASRTAPLVKGGHVSRLAIVDEMSATKVNIMIEACSSQDFVP